MSIFALVIAFTLLLFGAIASAFWIEHRVEAPAAKLKFALELTIGALRNDLAVARLLRPSAEPSAPKPTPRPPPAIERRLVTHPTDDDEAHQRPTVQLADGAVVRLGDEDGERESIEEMTRVSKREPGGSPVLAPRG